MYGSDDRVIGTRFRAGLKHDPNETGPSAVPADGLLTEGFEIFATQQAISRDKNSR